MSDNQEIQPSTQITKDLETYSPLELQRERLSTEVQAFVQGYDQKIARAVGFVDDKGMPMNILQAAEKWYGDGDFHSGTEHVIDARLRNAARGTTFILTTTVEGARVSYIIRMGVSPELQIDRPDGQLDIHVYRNHREPDNYSKTKAERTYKDDKGEIYHRTTLETFGLDALSQVVPLTISERDHDLIADINYRNMSEDGTLSIANGEPITIRSLKFDAVRKAMVNKDTVTLDEHNYPLQASVSADKGNNTIIITDEPGYTIGDNTPTLTDLAFPDEDEYESYRYSHITLPFTDSITHRLSTLGDPSPSLPLPSQHS